MRVVCGLLEPTEGQVRVGGVDVLRDPERAQEHIGYLSDFFSLYEDMKVWEYLDYFAHAYKMAEFLCVRDPTHNLFDGERRSACSAGRLQAN